MKRLAHTSHSNPILIAMLAFALALFAVIPAGADGSNTAASQPVRFTLRAELLTPAYSSGQSGSSRWQTLGSDSAIHSGDVIRYTLDIVNTGARPVAGLVVTQPIPNGTTYVLNTAQQTASYATVTYLAGEAEQHAAHPAASQTSGRNGATLAAPATTPAPADTYKQVRWTFTQALPAKAAMQVSYQVVVR